MRVGCSKTNKFIEWKVFCPIAVALGKYLHVVTKTIAESTNRRWTHERPEPLNAQLHADNLRVPSPGEGDRVWGHLHAMCQDLLRYAYAGSKIQHFDSVGIFSQAKSCRRSCVWNPPPIACRVERNSGTERASAIILRWRQRPEEWRVCLEAGIHYISAGVLSSCITTPPCLMRWKRIGRDVEW